MICFVHIERAGGTTLHEIFRTNFPSYLMITPCKPWTNEDSNVFTKDEFRAIKRTLPFTKGIGGHTTRSYLGYEEFCNDKIQYITYLRDPVERYISHYFYQKFKKNIDWTFESFMAELRFDNFMTKRIAGTFNLEMAIENLETQFSFVGLTDEFDLSLLFMREELGLKDFSCYYKKMNSGEQYKKNENINEIKATYLDEIIEHNRLDIELYLYARSNIFPRYVEKNPHIQNRAVNMFRDDNKEFEYNLWKRRALHLYRSYACKPILTRLYRKYHP